MGPVPNNSLMRTPLWRMHLCGNRERIAQAAARISATGTAVDHALLLLMIRRKHARKALLNFTPFTLPYSERERRSALTALGLLWGALGRELGMALDPKASHFDRRYAHESLIRRRDQRAVRPLAEALVDGHALEDWQCIPTLAALGDKRAAGPLLRYVGITGEGEVSFARNLDIGIEVGRALHSLNAREALETIIESLRSSSATRRAAAALVLGGWGDESLAALLIPLLGDTAAAVRLAAITACGELKATGTLAAIQGRLSDPDTEVRIAAERANQQVSMIQAQRTVRAGKLTRADPDSIPQK